MHEVEIVKKEEDMTNEFEDQLLHDRIEEILAEAGAKRLPFDPRTDKITGSLKDLRRGGPLGALIYRFEIKNGGYVEYMKFDFLPNYAAIIKLLGFNEENENYKNLKNQLEEFAKNPIVEIPEELKSYQDLK